MDFILDENIPIELISWLNQKSHKVFLPAKGSSDEEVAFFAKKHKAILLTQDRHFTNALRFTPHNFNGIVRIKIHPSFIEDIISALDKLFRTFSKPEDFKGKLIILSREGFFKLKE